MRSTPKANRKSIIAMRDVISKQNSPVYRLMANFKITHVNSEISNRKSADGL